MIAPVLQPGASMTQLFGDSLLFARTVISINGGVMGERHVIHHNGLGWQRDLLQWT